MKSILATWTIVLIMVWGITELDFNNNNLAILRLITPLLGLVAICIIEKRGKIEHQGKVSTVVKRILAIPFLTLGFNWICIFCLTTYRSHQRPLIIPLSIAFLGLGLYLTHSNTTKTYKNTEQNV